VRRIVIPDADNQLSHYPVGVGEALIIVTKTQYSSADPQTLVNNITGKAPSDDRYAQIDTMGNVVNVLLLDFGCHDDSAPIFNGYTLLPHPTAGPGWFSQGTRWYPPVENTTTRRPRKIFRFGHTT